MRPFQFFTGAPVFAVTISLIVTVSFTPSPSGEKIFSLAFMTATGFDVSRTNTGDFIG